MKKKIEIDEQFLRDFAELSHLLKTMEGEVKAVKRLTAKIVKVLQSTKVGK